MLSGSRAKTESITWELLGMLAIHLRNSPSGLRYQSGQTIKHEDSWLLECWRGNIDAGFSQVPLLLLLTSSSLSLEQIPPFLWENSSARWKKKNPTCNTWRDGSQAECIRVSVWCYRLIRGWIIHVSTWKNSKDKDSFTPLHFSSPAFLSSVSRSLKSHVWMPFSAINQIKMTDCLTWFKTQVLIDGLSKWTTTLPCNDI